MVTGELSGITSTCPPCPSCGGKLWENAGAYWCQRCKDVTTAVQRQQAGNNQSATSAMGTSNISTAGPLPAEIPCWSWAAFIFNWIWLLARGLYVWAIIQLVVSMFFIIISAILWLLAPVILSIFAVINLIWCVIIGFEGNTLDWRHGQYANTYAFRQSHRHWRITMKIILWILIVEVVSLIIVLMCRLFAHIGSGL